jgi:hypothetical protein
VKCQGHFHYGPQHVLGLFSFNFKHILFNFFLQNWISMNFIICFDLFSMDLSRYHDLSREFYGLDRLTRVFFSFFFNWIFFFQFHTLTLGVWELKFIISFYFLSMELFWSPNLGFIGWRGLFFYFFYFFIFQFNP